MKHYVRCAGCSRIWRSERLAAFFRKTRKNCYCGHRGLILEPFPVTLFERLKHKLGILGLFTGVM